MIYKQENITPNKFIRTFKSDVDSSELVWHRDKKSRIVEVLNDSDWFVQLENELPRKLNKGDIFFILLEFFQYYFYFIVDLVSSENFIHIYLNKSM